MGVELKVGGGVGGKSIPRASGCQDLTLLHIMRKAPLHITMKFHMNKIFQEKLIYRELPSS